MNGLVHDFPNLTVVDMSAILKQALTVMEQVIAAVQFVFLFALAAGLLVLCVALLATQDERVQEAAVIRACETGDCHGPDGDRAPSRPFRATPAELGNRVKLVQEEDAGRSGGKVNQRADVL